MPTASAQFVMYFKLVWQWSQTYFASSCMCFFVKFNFPVRSLSGAHVNCEVGGGNNIFAEDAPPQPSFRRSLVPKQPMRVYPWLLQFLLILLLQQFEQLQLQ